MACTQFPTNLQIVGHLIINDLDFRTWEAPPEGFIGELVYDEPSGDVMAGEHVCERVWPDPESHDHFVTVPDEPAEDKELAAILAHNEAAGFEAIPVPKR